MTPSPVPKFAAEIVAAVRYFVADFPVLFRYSQWKSDNYDARLAETPEELEAILTPLAAAGVDAFHASTRRYWLPEFDGSDLNLAGWTKKLTGKPTITVGSVGLDGDFIKAFMGELQGGLPRQPPRPPGARRVRPRRRGPRPPPGPGVAAKVRTGRLEELGVVRPEGAEHARRPGRPGGT